MGCSSCGGAKAIKASSTEPREVVMPDGKKVTVTSARQEAVERDMAYRRMRDAEKRKGYSVKR
jgi:hypothetical protein